MGKKNLTLEEIKEGFESLEEAFLLHEPKEFDSSVLDLDKAAQDFEKKSTVIGLLRKLNTAASSQKGTLMHFAVTRQIPELICWLAREFPVLIKEKGPLGITPVELAESKKCRDIKNLLDRAEQRHTQQLYIPRSQGGTLKKIFSSSKINHEKLHSYFTSFRSFLTTYHESALENDVIVLDVEKLAGEFSAAIIAYKFLDGIKYADVAGKTLMHIAAEIGVASAICWLHMHDPELVNSFDHDGNSPLHIACLHKRKVATKALLRLSSRDTVYHYNQNKMRTFDLIEHDDSLFDLFIDAYPDTKVNREIHRRRVQAHRHTLDSLELEELRDVHADTLGQLNGLRRENATLNEQLERAMKCAEELQSNYFSKIEKAETRIETLNAGIKETRALEAELESLKQDVERLESALQAATSENEALTASASTSTALNAALASEKEKVAELKDLLSTLTTEHQATRSSLATAKEEISTTRLTHQTVLHEHQQQLQVVKAEGEQWRERLEAFEREQQTMKAAHLESLQSLEKRLQAANRKKDKLSAEAKAAKSTHQELQAKDQQTIERLERALAEEKEKNKQLSAKLERAQEKQEDLIEAHQDEIEQLQKSLQRATLSNEQLLADIQAAEDVQHGLQKTHESEIKRLEAEIQSQEEKTVMLNKLLFEKNSELEQKTDELEHARQNAIQLQRMVDQDASDAKVFSEKVEHLESKLDEVVKANKHEVAAMQTELDSSLRQIKVLQAELAEVQVEKAKLQGRDPLELARQNIAFQQRIAEMEHKLEEQSIEHERVMKKIRKHEKGSVRKLEKEVERLRKDNETRQENDARYSDENSEEEVLPGSQAPIPRQIQSDAFYYASQNNCRLLEPLLKHGITNRIVDAHGRSLLHEAVLRLNLDAVVLLRRYGADVEHKDSQLRTAKFYCQNAQLLKPKYTMSSQEKNALIAKINSVLSPANEHPFYLAVENNQYQEAQKHKGYYPDINARGAQGKAVLHIAADNLEQGMIAMLLAAGANVHLRSGNGDTPLHHAILQVNCEENQSSRSRNAIQTLLDANANPDRVNKKRKIKQATPRLLAKSREIKALLNQRTLGRALIARMIHAQIRLSHTMAMLISLDEHDDIIKMSAKYLPAFLTPTQNINDWRPEAEVLAGDKLAVQSALRSASNHSHLKSYCLALLEIIENLSQAIELPSAGVSSTLIEEAKAQALLDMISNHDPHLTIELIPPQFLPEHFNKEGLKFLTTAVNQGNLTAVQALLKALKSYSKDELLPLFQVAKEKQYLLIAISLAKALGDDKLISALIKTKDSFNHYPIHNAIIHGEIELAQFMMDKKVKCLSYQDGRGRTSQELCTVYLNVAKQCPEFYSASWEKLQQLHGVIQSKLSTTPRSASNRHSAAEADTSKPNLSIN